MTFPLLRALPGLEASVSRLPLGAFPTPVEPLEVGVPGAEVWVKRDDLSGGEYGGNKVRKLEFLLAEARERGAGRILTAGAVGSHHALATTVYARRLELPVTLLLSPQRPTEHVRKVLRTLHALGAELRLVPKMAEIPEALERERDRLRDERPVVIPLGGSSPRGTLGYVNAALELLDQVEAGLLPVPRVVHVACGTMGTAVGLALGFALAGASIRLNAVRVVAEAVTNEEAFRRLLGSTAALLREAGAGPLPEGEVMTRVRLRHDQFGEGYGKGTAAGRRAAERLAGAPFRLDPTYTEKAAAGLLAATAEGEGGPHLYWHTLSHGLPGVEEARPPEELPREFRSFLEPQ